MQVQRQGSAALPAWVAPLAVAAVAIPTFVAFWLGDQPGRGAAWAIVVLALAAVLGIGHRFDAVRIAAGTDDDERTRDLELRATSAMGLVLVVALAGLFLASGLRGETGLTYGVLLLLAEATRFGAMIVLTRRR